MARYFLFFLIFLIGLLVGFLLSGFHGVVLKADVTYAEVVNVTLVIILAALAPYFVEIFISSRRIEKNIIIDELDVLRSEIEYIDSKLFSCMKVEGEYLFQDIMVRLKRVRQTMDSIESVTDKVSSFKKDDLIRLDSLITDYWDVITGISGITPNTKRVPSSLYRKQSNKFNDIAKVVRHAVIRVNRM